MKGETEISRPSANRAPIGGDVLATAIAEARALIAAHGLEARQVPATADPLPSLLDRARAMMAEAQAAPPDVVRTLHHFACSGGSLFSKLVVAGPNVRLLSEIDPLSQIGLDVDQPRFAPTDMIRLLQYSHRGIDPPRLEEIFLAGLGVLRRQCRLAGEYLVLRDHAHSHYCAGPEIPVRNSLRALALRSGPVVSVVTVRDPLDSWLSIVERRWVHFTPGTLDEYCRRYLAFLDDHHDVAVIRYEDLLDAPKETLRRLCATLALPFDPLALEMLSAVHVTGDSGRTGQHIARRPRRPVPDALTREMAASDRFNHLRSRLGYDG